MFKLARFWFFENLGIKEPSLSGFWRFSESKNLWFHFFFKGPRRLSGFHEITNKEVTLLKVILFVWKGFEYCN
jgi:hypothetical protein